MPKVIDYKNPVFASSDGNYVDLEILTDKYGWIPTTIILDDGDTHEHILQIKDWINENSNLIAPYVALELTANESADMSRRAEYPAIQDQLDMIFHDLENGTQNWQDEIRAIKRKYPKV